MLIYHNKTRCGDCFHRSRSHATMSTSPRTTIVAGPIIVGRWMVVRIVSLARCRADRICITASRAPHATTREEPVRTSRVREIWAVQISTYAGTTSISMSAPTDVVGGCECHALAKTNIAQITSLRVCELVRSILFTNQTHRKITGCN